VASGADIIPTVTTLASHEPPRSVADTEKGEELRREVAVLEALLEAYEGSVLLEER